MRIHQGVDEQLFRVAAHSSSKGPRRIAQELLLSWGLEPPHKDDLSKASMASIQNCSEQTSSTTDADTFESSQPWLGYW